MEAESGLDTRPWTRTSSGVRRCDRWRGGPRHLPSKRRRRGREGKGREGKGREGKGRGWGLSSFVRERPRLNSSSQQQQNTNTQEREQSSKYLILSVSSRTRVLYRRGRLMRQRVSPRYPRSGIKGGDFRPRTAQFPICRPYSSYIITFPRFSVQKMTT